MKISVERKSVVLEKSKKIEEAKVFLKKEFIGIDSIIDELVDSIKPFYFFPESLKKPLVVNLWGLTGTGKTSILIKLFEFLELSNCVFKYDIGEYANSEYKLRNDISENLYNKQKYSEENLIFIFDEFQLGRTINEDGKEVDRIGLRPMWELIDSGIIDTNFGANSVNLFREFSDLKNAYEYGVQIENGIVVSNEDIFLSIVNASDNVFPMNFSVYDKKILKNGLTEKHAINRFKLKASKPYILSSELITYMKDQNKEFFIKHLKDKNKINDLNSLRNIFSQYNFEELLNVIKINFLQKTLNMKKINLSKSLIFCIGNLDEAFRMAGSVNPDSDPDMFHKYSKKITVPQIKASLARRYRMEQIGRLGNTHIIYPSLSRKDYENVILHYLSKRIDYYKKEFDLNLSFTDNLCEILYKESVYPSQGVRPVISSMNNMIDTYNSKIISDILLNVEKNNVDSVIWDYNKRKETYEISILSEGMEILKLSYPINLVIEKLRKSDRSEEQAYTAVHEAGHAIAAIFGANILPKEVVTKTANAQALGYCSYELPEFRTKDILIKDIIIAYGGIEAERLIFGDDMMSTGASNDLQQASNMIISLFKEYGMMNSCSVRIGTSSDNDLLGKKLHTLELEKEIKKFSNKLRKKTAVILKKHKSELIKLSQVLSKKAKLKGKQILNAIDNPKVEIKSKDNYYSIRETLNKNF